jgi:hypothetical protein
MNVLELAAAQADQVAARPKLRLVILNGRRVISWGSMARKRSISSTACVR